MTEKSKPTYIIARVCNRRTFDYYAGRDPKDDQCMFTGKNLALIYTNHNTAYGMTIRLKRLLPVTVDGVSLSYEVVEVQ